MNAWKNRAVRLGRKLYYLAAVAAIWIAMTGTALAKWKDPDAEAANAGSGEKGYSLQYALVLMCIALGMVVVCRASRRESESKLTKQEDDE